MRTMTINEKQYNVMDAQEVGIVAGYVLDEAAARHLFQVRSENVSNNCRSKIKAMEAEGKSPDEIAQYVTDYDRGYSFSMPGTGTGRKVVDPLEKECRALAKDKIRKFLDSQGRKLKDVDPEKIEREMDRIAQLPEIIKLATKWLAEKRRAGAEDLELDL